MTRAEWIMSATRTTGMALGILIGFGIARFLGAPQWRAALCIFCALTGYIVGYFASGYIADRVARLRGRGERKRNSADNK